MKLELQQLNTYHSHRDALVKYATPITGCRARAEDIVQEAFLRVLSEKPREPKNAIAYIYKTVRNLAIDLVRRSTMEAGHQNVEKISWLEPSPETTPEEVTMQHHALQRISVVIAQLPPAEQKAIRMHRLEGHNMAYIAKKLAVSVSTVHRLICNAIVAISSEMDE